jgi:outer membrane protein
MKSALAVLQCLLLVSSPVWAQQQDYINPVRPSAPVLWRPYLPVTVPPVRLANSPRLRDLIRANRLYLTAQDAIALALENNIDIESGRYDSSGWRLERARAGGALPGVPTGASQTASVASGQGVLGSQAAAGVRISGSNGANAGTTNVTVAQVGTVAQTYDPTIQEATTFSHRSLPQPSTVQTTSVLVQGQRIYTASYQEGFETGGSVTLSYNNHFLNENAPTDVLNPSVAPTLSVSVSQNLLQGFGVAVNTKDITVAKINVGISDLNFKTQVERTVVTVLNNYYALVGNYEDFRSKQGALETARKFLSETQRRVDLGASAQLDVTTAQNQVAAAQQASVNSQAAIQQQELQLKSLISRTGSFDPLIASVEIVPLDGIVIPAADDLPPTKDLVQEAFRNRSDLLAEKENIRGAEVSSIATINGLLPTAAVQAGKSNAGTAGDLRIVNGSTADAYFAGGTGTALGQILRNNFPTESISAFGQVQIYDRVAQADHAIDQLQIRQQQLAMARDFNQVQVVLTNSVVALRQARARYEAAAQSLMLQQKLYEAEQKKFAVGESTTYNVTQQQRDFINAQSAQLSAMVTWQSARLSLDQTTGSTLAVHHVSIEQAQTGRIDRPSSLPASLPENPR